MAGGDRKLGEFIRTQRSLANMSLRQLAGLAKVSNAYLSQVERGIYKPSAQVLKAIAESLELSAESMFARAGLLEGEQPRTTDVERAIRLDQRLTTEQKDALIRVYRGFVGA